MPKPPAKDAPAVNGPPAATTEAEPSAAQHPPERPAIIAALEAVSDADLVAIDQELADLRKKVAALEAVRRVVKVAVNGPPVTAKGAGAGGGAGAGAGSAAKKSDDAAAIFKIRRTQVAGVLAHGPLLATVIANRLGVDGRSLIGVLKSDWFQATPQGYRLTEVGRREMPGGTAAPKP